MPLPRWGHEKKPRNGQRPDWALDWWTQDDGDHEGFLEAVIEALAPPETHNPAV